MRTMLKFRTLVASAAALGIAGAAHAQFGGSGWSFECIDPANTAPYSTDYATFGVANQFIGVRMGLSGTVTYGGQNGPCYAPSARTLSANGRFAFFNGAVGSMQSDFDDNLALTVGAPRDPVGDYCFAKIIRYADAATSADSKQVLFAPTGYFVGASNRYFVATFSDGGASVQLTTRVIGDAIRMQWHMTNTTTGVLYLGLRFGAYVGMRSEAPDGNGYNQANSLLGGATSIPKSITSNGETWIGFNTSPTTKPIRVERAFMSSRENFPDYVNFQWGQSYPYGLRVENNPTPNTKDATPVAHFAVGNHGNFQSPNMLFNNNMNPRVFTDFGVGDPILDTNPDPIQEVSDNYLDETCFLQTYRPEGVAPGGNRDVIQYFRSPWSTGDYAFPYIALIDAPRLIAVGNGTNGLDPNPMTIYAHVDNQYAEVDKEVPITNMRCTITLPEGGGLRLVTGEQQIKTISKINANAIGTVSWQVVADGTKFGRLPYTIKFQGDQGPVKTLETSLLVAASPQVRVAEGPNFLSFPWVFSDTSLDSVLGLKAGVDYVAYRWESDLGEYVPVSSATRGTGVWVVPTSDHGYLALNGASSPSDITTGGAVTVLRPGWNMIGNPYNYPVLLSQLVAVAEDSPATVLTWQDLVDGGLVNSSLAYWQRNAEDPNSGTYAFTTGASDYLLPNTGYWIYVTAYNPIKMTWPAIYADGLPNSERSTKVDPSKQWQQSEKQWRVQLSARNEQGMDANNFVGVASSAATAKQWLIMEPPAAINSKIQLSVAGTVNGKATRLAESLSDSNGHNEWTVNVKSEIAGDVTVTWPNISSVPRNVRLQVVDPATNTTRDLRFASSYTFHMDEPGVRTLKVQADPGAPARAVIGDVIVTRPSRDPRAGFSITYSLSSGANTSIRILNGTGKEIYAVTRGRADGAGANTATWQMRDNANRAVAPGTYQVEIVAETTSGERVRKIVPVNVVR